MMSESSRPLHVLLVEDDADHAYLVRRSMKGARYRTALEHVTDGAEALRYLQAQGQYADRPRPDLILLDLKLPKLSGHEVLDQVKGSPLLRAIPVVVLTTSDAEADRFRAYELHANSYIVKPLDGEAFRAVIEQLNLYWGAVDIGPPTGSSAGR